ncbi:SPOR domain-containing protein [Aquibacillus salsiterrae]|uniref:SPOR domain-containing protein n=1 Tax=Aquibacillus salsiterrae TaxID=2950439 RepID=A0A9X3WKA7_9BACI|nr:SPOR domain-containing protein [Aquibacillus salsiterrae]MDC3418651.1 SPOR domain-containing protein [Aquibacillus salsiterrae]
MTYSLVLSWINVGALTVFTQSSKSERGTNKYYQVQVGAFSRKENAEELLGKVKRAGFEGYIKFE